MCWMGCAKAVLEFYAQHANSDLVSGLSDLVAMYYQNPKQKAMRWGLAQEAT